MIIDPEGKHDAVKHKVPLNLCMYCSDIVRWCCESPAYRTQISGSPGLQLPPQMSLSPTSSRLTLLSLPSVDHLDVLSYYLPAPKYSPPMAALVIAVSQQASCRMLDPPHQHTPPAPQHSLPLSESHRLCV